MKTFYFCCMVFCFLMLFLGIVKSDILQITLGAGGMILAYTGIINIDIKKEEK